MFTEYLLCARNQTSGARLLAHMWMFSLWVPRPLDVTSLGRMSKVGINPTFEPHQETGRNFQSEAREYIQPHLTFPPLTSLSLHRVVWADLWLCWECSEREPANLAQNNLVKCSLSLLGSDEGLIHVTYPNPGAENFPQASCLTTVCSHFKPP